MSPRNSRKSTKTAATAAEASVAKSLEGRTAPAFTATTDTDDSLALASLRGKNVVLFFYPKDDTATGVPSRRARFRDAL